MTLIPDRIPVSSPDLISYMDRKYSDHPATDNQVRIVVKFDGSLDESRLARAVRLSLDAEPVLGCRLVERPLRLYWQRCAGLDSVFEFREVDLSNEGRAIEDYFFLRLDPLKEPQVKVGLIRSDCDTLIVRMCHILIDGGASFEYLGLLSSIYRRLGNDPDYRPEANLNGCRDSFQVLRNFNLIKLLSSSTKVRVPKPAWDFRSADNGDMRDMFLTRRVGPEHFNHLIKYSKEYGVTMGDVLLTAVYRALFETIDPPENVPLPMLVPVNLRKYIPCGRGESLCSLTSGYFPEITRKRSEPFEETLARVHAVMEANKSKREEIGQVFLMELVFAPGYIVPRVAGPFLASSLTFPTFSNIGIVDPKAADFGDTPVRDIIPAGGVTAPPNFLLGSHTYKGAMAFTTVVHCSDAYKARLEGFFDTLIKELPGYAPEASAEAMTDMTAVGGMKRVKTGSNV